MGLGQPVALMIDEDPELRDKVSQRGFRVFTDEETFKSYVGSSLVSEYTVADQVRVRSLTGTG